MRRLVAAFAALALLAGCQVRPLYAPTTTGASIQTDLPAIAVDEPATRQEQVFRNALIFGLRGGGDGSPPLYKMNYRMNLDVQQLAIEAVTGTPTFYQVHGRIYFILQDYSTGKALLVDEEVATASYNRSSQNFANVRAERDAEDRVATALARKVETRLATYFAAR